MLNKIIIITYIHTFWFLRKSNFERVLCTATRIDCVPCGIRIITYVVWEKKKEKSKNRRQPKMYVVTI